MKYFIISLILFYAIYIVGFQMGIISERENNMKLINTTFQPIKDCLQEVHFTSNGIDLGTYWSVSDIFDQPERNCGREVGTILHNYLRSF